MKDTVLFPRADPRPSTSFARQTGPLAPELLSQSVRRLRVLALLYAFIFFMAGFFPSLLVAEDRAHMLGDPLHWVPGVASIALALLVAAFTRLPSVPPSTVLNVALVFEVVSCYGIAIAEYIAALPARHERLDRPVVGGGLDVAVRRRHSNPPASKPPCSRWPR